MTAALIGLVGALLAAALTGLIASEHERRRHTKLANDAGRLIVDELDHAEQSMLMTVEKGTWWPTALPTGRWESRASDLAGVIDDELRKKLNRAYWIVGLRNRLLERARSVAKEKKVEETVVDEEKDELAADARTIGNARRELAEVLRTGLKASRSKAAQRARSIFLPVVIVLGVLLTALLFIPFANVTPGTVAAELEQDLGPEILVECDPADEDWTCTLHKLDQVRANCLLLSSTAGGFIGAGRDSHGMYGDLRQASGLDECSTEGEPATISGSASPDGLQMPFVTMDAASRAVLKSWNSTAPEAAAAVPDTAPVVTVPIPTASLISRFWATVSRTWQLNTG